MRIISLKILREFWESDAEQPLRIWYRIALHAEWNNISEVRQTFPHADAVKSGEDTLTVFNIRGNTYRLIVRIRYDHHVINIRTVLTHKEYDKNNWKKQS
jgi:mRNA interferase HigB